ncbi:MAG TPA: phytoene desaturase family protein, partial [Ktedonobacteraceae bacterium]|nr:phytoene desaturase family protein [Ktedonobacteraceae bacterium]
MSQYKKQVIVIGAGIGGLSAAVHLAARGYDVRVIERHERVGGKLNRIERQGFTFDTGPSLITMPYVFEALFRLAGRKLEDYLQLVPLDPTCRYVYRDGTVINAWRDRQRMADEFSKLTPHDGAAFSDFLAYAGQIYEAAADPFLYHSLGGPFDVMRTFARYILKGHPDGEATKNIRTGKRPSILQRWRAVKAALESTTLSQRISSFFEDEHIRQLFERYATYNGSSPYQVGAVYSIIPYVELASGGWYLQGGIYSLAEALCKLATELGVAIQTGSNVQRILVSYGEARGVVLDDGQILRSDVVIANSDVVTTHRELLSPSTVGGRYVRQLEKLEPSCSGFVVMLGIDRTYPQLEHHNIFFSDDYQREFDDLFVTKQPQQNPTIYVCVTSRSDPSQAPAGHENLFILVNAPYLTSQSHWKRDATTYRDLIIDRLVEHPYAGLEDLREHIVCEEILTPENFRQKYGANRGSIYGLSSNQRMAP